MVWRVLRLEGSEEPGCGEQAQDELERQGQVPQSLVGGGHSAAYSEGSGDHGEVLSRPCELTCFM